MEFEVNEKFDINDYFKKIKELLYKLGYQNKVVNINTAINLYNTYGQEFSEKVFIKEILDVNYEIYKKYGNQLSYNTFINKVLGISQKQISDAKTHSSFVKIIDIKLKNTMEIINKKFK